MKIQTFAKYVDQPLIVNKLNKQMPAILTASGIGIAVHDTFKHKEDKKRGIKNFIIATGIIGSTLYSIKKFNLIEIPKTESIIKKQKNSIKEYINNTNLRDKNLLSILNNCEGKHLSTSQIQALFDKLPNDQNRAVLFKNLFMENKNLSSSEIFSEIGRLSLLGAIPVVSGIASGIVADKITNTANNKSTANKIKEGFYQYFANIFLCNVGAGAALLGAEQLQKHNLIKPLTPLKKLAVILTGITATGIVGGSYIANYLSKKIINPIFSQKKEKGIYSERRPEALDIALHSDDIATAGVLSGFKWIEPMLPVMYFFSGFRAGIGYRNTDKS